MGFIERFRPNQYAKSIYDITPQSLLDLGLDGVILDLDNTLLPWKNSDLPQATKAWIDDLKKANLKLCILSNTHSPKRLINISNELGILGVSRAMKPLKAGFLRASLSIGCSPHRTAVVGDQLLTDIVGGNLAKMHTILVKPMHRREFAGTKISRVIEWVILLFIKPSGTIPQKVNVRIDS